MDMESKRDQRVYVSRNNTASFERNLAEKGYEVSKSEPNQTTYRNEEGRTITKQKWGLVRYHVPLSKEEVANLVAERENIPVDEFTKAVTDITEKLANIESEVMK